MPLIVQVIAFAAPAVLLVFFGSYRALCGLVLYWIDFTSSVNFMAFLFCDATKLRPGTHISLNFCYYRRVLLLLLNVRGAIYPDTELHGRELARRGSNSEVNHIVSE